MNDTNPYVSPVTQSDVDSQWMRFVATRLSAARKNPPSVIRTLTTWPGVPLLIVVGAFVTLVFAALMFSENSPLTTHWPVGVACGIFGAILRDIGYARRAVRLWPAQSEFINWEKVDQYAQ